MEYFGCLGHRKGNLDITGLFLRCVFRGIYTCIYACSLISYIFDIIIHSGNAIFVWNVSGSYWVNGAAWYIIHYIIVIYIPCKTDSSRSIFKHFCCCSLLSWISILYFSTRLLHSFSNTSCSWYFTSSSVSFVLFVWLLSIITWSGRLGHSSCSWTGNV